MAKKKQKKFYVVWRGYEIGIFDNWADCQKSVMGFTGAEYKSFKSKEAAEEAYYGGNYRDYAGQAKDTGLSEAEKAKYGKPNLDSIAVDAACSSKQGAMEYQGVDTQSGAVFFRQGPFLNGTNNVGEFLAIVHALAFLKKWDRPNLPIYSDSRTAMKWVRDKRANTTLKSTSNNKILFELIARAEKWLKENTYTNELLKWETKAWGEIPADFGRK